jgi:hypothetical protein
MDSRFATTCAIAAPLLAALCGASPTQAQTTLQPPFMSYAAKFVCGVQKTDADVVKGDYATAINIHNPQAIATVAFVKKAVVAFAERSTAQGPISPQRGESLKPDAAMFVDCTDIRRLFSGTALPTHIEGFVVIEVPPQAAGGNSFLQLDVVGKYTVRHENSAVAGADPTAADANGIDIEPVTGKLITQ